MFARPTMSAPRFHHRFPTPRACRIALAALLASGFLLHLLYLTWNCPIDLTGDEAHYWTWSQRLDVAYYSKGPLVAWIIRASTALLGDTMPAVRLPALLLAVGTSLCTYWLVRKLFRSARLALGTVALAHTVPLFVAGSLIMTIDPPFFFCWALTTCLATRAIFDARRGAWIAVGLTAGVGLLAKYAMPLWYVGLFAFLIVDPRSRRWLRAPWPWLALAITLAFFAAPIAWNARHGWVTFRHVGRQTGVTETQGSSLTNPLAMLATQAGIVGPILAVFLVFAIVDTLRRWRREPADDASPIDVRRATMFLLCIGGGFFVVILVASFRANIEPNWPAPAFFTLVPLAAWWIGQRLATDAAWRPVRGFFWAHVAIGLVAMLLIHHTEWLAPLAARAGIAPKRADLGPINKARGNAEYGQIVGDLLREHPGALVFARSYQDASQLAFYTPGHPVTFNVSSYLLGKERSRHSQFDVWPDHDLSNLALVGRDAILFGSPDDDGLIRAAFDSVKLVREVPIVRMGLVVRDAKPIYLCRNFKGMKPAEPGSY